MKDLHLCPLHVQQSELLETLPLMLSVYGFKQRMFHNILNNGLCLCKGAVFVKPHIREGLLPSLLRALMMGRSQTQKKMKESLNSIERSIMDGRQKALKVVANAIYGFTGSNRAAV